MTSDLSGSSAAMPPGVEAAVSLRRLLQESTDALAEPLVLQLCHELGGTPAGREQFLGELERALEDGGTRRRALEVLHLLRTRGVTDQPLRVVRTSLRTTVLDDHVDLLLVPSIFEPEDWSFTFLEGLLRQPPEHYADRTLAELGTGSGWVSLALLRATDLKSSVALDLNPVAVRVARINAYLNSYDDALSLRDEHGRRPLFERCIVQHSDLLGAVLGSGTRLDLVVGCIPQVLAPSPSLDPQSAVAQTEEEQLYDLSNYFVLQGVYEDQFGLGLLARALEQAVGVLNAGGRVVLNVAGRPGTHVVEAMFARRGYRVRELWSRRVAQAADTNIEVLADLEERTGQQFEFYVHAHSREPIGAATALALQRAQRPIWHDVRVLEAKLRYERDLAPFYLAVQALGYGKFLDQIDLSAISAEQVAFLRSLAEYFSRARVAPYTHEQGSAALRNHIARYLEEHFSVRVAAQELFVAPNRQWSVLGMLFSLCSPGDTVLLSAASAQSFSGCCEQARVRAIAGNDDLEELTELIGVLGPRLAIVSVADGDKNAHGALVRLSREAAARGTTVIVDGSRMFDITSSVHRNAVFEYFAGELAPHVFVLVGLAKNRVYPTLKPSFLLRCGPSVRRALAAFAEATYSRGNCFTELYYDGLFAEILSFQLERGARRQESMDAGDGREPELAARARELLAWPAFDESLAAVASFDVIRLDYGENELSMPDRLTQGVLLGFTNLSSDVEPARLSELIAAWATAREASPVAAREIVLGAGVFPLIYFATVALRERLGRAPRVVLPAGHYGFLPPVFTVAGAHVRIVETREQDAFELTREALESLSETPDVAFVANPNNPTGLFYSAETLRDLVAYAEQRGTWLFSDEIFSGLDVSGERSAPPALRTLAQGTAAASRIVSFNGLSKLFAAGGLRVGWLRCQDDSLVRDVAALSARLSVERHARVAVEVLFRGYLTESGAGGVSAELEAYQSGMCDQLARQRDRLARVWLRAGATIPAGRAGGLFLFPDVRALYGRVLRLPSGESATLTEENFAELLLTEFGLRVNSAVWAAVGGHVRCCFSLSSTRFEQAVARLNAFVDCLQDSAP